MATAKNLYLLPQNGAMDKAGLDKFKNCEICGSDMGKISLDSPLYCAKCIAEMEKLSMSPRKYVQYRELRETLGNPKSKK